MKIMISGCVAEEGRFSMVRTARSLYRYIGAVLASGDEVALDKGVQGRIATRLNYQGLDVKLQKRLLLPLRLRCAHYDVLHIVDNDYGAAVPPQSLSRTVITCHDMMPFLIAECPEEVFSSRFGLHFYRRGLQAMQTCPCVVTDSEFTKRCVLQYTKCREDQIHVVYLGVDPCFNREATDSAALQDFETRYGLHGKRVVLHVGVTERYKNIETVLRVLRRLLDACDESVVLLKVGGRFDGENRDLVRQLNLANHIVHVTGLSESELVDGYHAADLLLWPSKFEGFGLPVLEAMACGTPVVCSNGGALPEVAGAAACIHDPQDEESLFHSCQRVLEDRDFAQRLRDAGLLQASQFTWTRAAEQYYALYREIDERTDSA